MAQLGLGTVQLGLPYGNRADLPLLPEADAHAILNAALEGGIRVFDTAAAYGESETRLGSFGLHTRAPGAEILTKVPKIPEALWAKENELFEFVTSMITGSWARLKSRDLPLIFFHEHALGFLTQRSTAKLFQRLIAGEWCSEIGISVYTPEEATAALELPHVHALQVPVNLVDDRFVNQPMLEVYRTKRPRLIARSVFLQGVLVTGAPLPQAKRQGELAELKDKAQKIADARGVTLHSLALAYALCEWGKTLETVLMGADSVAVLQENLRLVETCSPRIFSDELRGQLASLANWAKTKNLQDPRQWG